MYNAIMRDMDIDEGFLRKKKEERVAWAAGYFLLVLAIAMPALPLILMPEILPYLPQVMPKFGWGPIIPLSVVLGFFAFAVLYGRREERIRFQQLREATAVLRSAPADAVTAHAWWFTNSTKQSPRLHFTLCPENDNDADGGPPRVVQAFAHYRTRDYREAQLAATRYADPTISRVEVLRFQDGTLAAVLPIEPSALKLPPPPRCLTRSARLFVLSLQGGVWGGTAITLFVWVFCMSIMSPRALRSAASHVIPLRVVSGNIVGEEPCTRCGGPKLRYRFDGRYEQRIHVDRETAAQFPPESKVTVEYLHQVPESARVREIPASRRPFSRGEVWGISSFFAVAGLLFLAGTLGGIYYGIRYHDAMRNRAFGWVTVTDVAWKDPAKPWRGAALTFLLHSATGETGYVTRQKSQPVSFMRDIKIPVLYSPNHPEQFMTVEEVLPNKCIRVMDDGLIALRPYGIAWLLGMAVFTGVLLYGSCYVAIAGS
jgi:hypothetical protein